MKKFLVGGAVRDCLMGKEPNDLDFVVVGATEQEMLTAGFKNVGESFPVFLHPETGEEYALARRERKTGNGYTGFSVEFGSDITLEEDLSRRDLTINAMAMDADTGEVVDPYGGRDDLTNKVLRHVGVAFSEDPLRVVRLARFYSRFTDFKIANETVALAVGLVDSGELDHLADERFMAEMEKMFETSPDPARFFMALSSFGALSKVKFFRDLLGTVDYIKIHCGFANGFLDSVESCSAELKVSIFVALFSAENAKQESAAITGRIKKMTSNIWAVRKMSVNVTPKEVFDFLQRNRSWDEQATTIKDFFNVMVTAEMIGESFPISAHVLAQATMEGRKVTADKYMHLSGAEIGKAMAVERLARITDVMKG